MRSNWFQVGEGLEALNKGKPKSYILRELIQNAWDEQIKKCEVTSSFKSPLATFWVTDDSPEGFKNIRDSYTLFNHTEKRNDPNKRGRFNFGEKQAFSVCTEAKVVTTKGSVVFDKNGRRSSRIKTERGTYVEIKVKMTKIEYSEVLNTIKLYLVPNGIKFVVNGKEIKYKKPFKTFEAKLRTEILKNGIFIPTSRTTRIDIHKSDMPFLFEMGIPVTSIECQYSVDIQQKVPLSTDRDTVSPAYLKDIYAEVLNKTSCYVEDENSSEGWIRTGLSDERVSEEAVDVMVHKRFGDKVCIADNSDPNAIDDAISSGYKIVQGRELSKDEWANIKKHNLLKTSKQLFGKRSVGYTKIKPDDNQKKVAEYAVKIAKRILKIDIEVLFVKSRAVTGADYDNRVLRFNVSRLGKHFFDKPVSYQTTDLIVHELGHEMGNHIEKSYHECLTMVAGKLVELALEESEFFDI